MAANEYIDFINAPLPHRFSTHMAQFSYDEKFETWLDLGSWTAIQQLIHNSEDNDAMGEVFKLCRVCPLDLSLLDMFEFTPKLLVHAKLSPLIPSMLLTKHLKYPISRCHVPESLFRQYIKVAERSAQIAMFHQQNHFMTCYGPNLAQIIEDHSKPWFELASGVTTELSSFLYLHEDFLRIINKHKSLVHLNPELPMTPTTVKIVKSMDLVFKLPSISGTAIILKSCVILEWMKEDWLIPIPYLLEIYNKITETISYLKYNLLLSKTIYPESHYQTSVKFMKHLAKKVSQFHSSRTGFICRDDELIRLESENRGFVYLKMIEGLGVAELIRRGDLDKDWDNTLLCDTLWKAVYDDKLTSKAAWEDSELCGLFQEMDCAQLASLIGTVKLCGHPSIEIKKGLDKLYERTHSTIQVNSKTCARARGVMVRDITLNFFRAHDKYPIFDRKTISKVPKLNELVNKRISVLSIEGKDLWNEISTDQWTLIKFGKNAEFDIVDNQVMLLKDKALGLTRSKVLKNQLLGRTQDEGQRSYRRALLAFLLDPFFDKGFRNYMSRYMGDDPWRKSVLDYLVIKLTAKELEEKPEGRFFGASPAYERNRRVVQESNVMSFMDSYVPEQLLTPNELSVIKKMFSFRYLHQAHPDSKILNISFDFSKWNNNMRHESVDIPAGEVLDSWFDTTLYRKTMKAFENMYVYYDDGIVQESWNGQLGGIEGLNQATWTLTFLGGLKDALETLGYVYHITVKGDDVRCAIVVPNSDLDSRSEGTFQDKIEAIRDTLLGNLQNLCQAMGWELNPQESFVSLSLICTSKQYQLNQTWLPTDVKKVMKCEALSNVAFPTLEDMISNIFSIAHSACSQATVIVPSYITACWTASRLLTRTLMNKLGCKNVNSDQIASLLLWPQVIGGPGSLPIQTFFVRGENDMLAVSVSLLRHLWMTLEEDNMRKYIGFILSQRIKKTEEFLMLLSDPYSIDIDQPVRPASKIKHTLRSQLKKLCKHPEILALLTYRSEREKNQLISTLSSLNPYYAKIATSIWECSPFYLIEEILSKFLNSSSILGFVTKGDYFHQYSRAGRKLIKEVKTASNDRLEYWIHVLNGVKLGQKGYFFGLSIDKWEDPLICSTEITHLLRCQAWNRDVQGITYPSLIDQVKVFSSKDVNLLRSEKGWDPRTTYSQIVIHHQDAKFQIDARSHHFATIDNAAPWLGSETKSSVRLPFQSTNIASPSMRKVRRLLTMLSSEHTFGKEFGILIRQVLSAYTSVSIDKINLLKSEEGGGHLAHRTPINSYSMVTMPNFRPNISQLINIHNEDIQVLKTDRTNRTINFASRHFFLTSAALLPLQTKQVIPRSYPRLVYSAFHHDRLTSSYNLCPYCCNAVPDGRVSITGAYDLDLSRFLDLNIISCSEAEESGLLKAAQQVVYNGVFSYITRLHLHIDNPLVVNQATRATIQRLVLSANQTHNNLKFEHVTTVPNTQLIDILSVSLGLKPLLGSQIQMSVLRCCQPFFLYESLLSECFWHAIHVAYGKDLLYTSFPLGSLIPEMYSSLASVFSQLSDAGMLNEISLVAQNRPPPGMQPVRIVWRYGSELLGGESVKNFFSAVWPTFNSWIADHTFPDYIKDRIIEEKTAEGIQDACRTHQKLMIRITFHIIHLTFFRQGGSTKVPLNRLNNKLKSPPDDDTDLWLIETCIEWAEDTISPLDLMRICILLTVGDWLVSRSFEAQEITRLANSNLSTPLVELSLDILDQNNLTLLMSSENLHEAQMMCLEYVCKTVPNLRSVGDKLILRMSILNATKILLDSDPEHWDRFANLIGSNIRSIEPLYNRKFYISSMDTDSRLIKDSFNAMSPEDIEAKFPRLIVRVPPTSQQRGNTIIWGKPSCHLSPHSSIRVGQLSTRYQNYDDASPSAKQTSQWILGQLDSLKTRSFENKCKLSSYNLSRIYMGLNKASLRYHEILRKTGIIDALIRLELPTAVVLGDGGGSVSILLLTLLRECQVVMVSLQNQENSKGTLTDGYLNEAPVEFAQATVPRDIYDRLTWKGMFPGDFTIPEVQDRVINAIEDIKGYADLVISDADYPDDTDGFMNNLLSILKVYFSVYSKCTPLIIRLIIKPKAPITRALMLLHSLFTHFHLYTSILSNPMTQEFWAICANPFNRPAAFKILDSFHDNCMVKSMILDCNISKFEELKTNINSVMEVLRVQSGAEPSKPFIQADFQESLSVTLPLSPSQAILELPHFESLWNPTCVCRSIDEYLLALDVGIEDHMRDTPDIPISGPHWKIREDRSTDLTAWSAGVIRIVDLVILRLGLQNPKILVAHSDSRYFSKKVVGWIYGRMISTSKSSTDGYYIVKRGQHRVLSHSLLPSLRLNIEKRIVKIIGIAARLISSLSILWHRVQDNIDSSDMMFQLVQQWSPRLTICVHCWDLMDSTNWRFTRSQLQQIGLKVCDP
nr:MAG: polymerase [Drosophila Dalkeith chuvirus]